MPGLPRISCDVTETQGQLATEYHQAAAHKENQGFHDDVSIIRGRRNKYHYNCHQDCQSDSQSAQAEYQIAHKAYELVAGGAACQR